ASPSKATNNSTVHSFGLDFACSSCEAQVVENERSDRVAKCLTVLAGRAVMYASKYAGIRDLIQSRRRSRERPCHAGHSLRRDREWRILAEERRNHGSCGPTLG